MEHTKGPEMPTIPEIGDWYKARSHAPVDIWWEEQAIGVLLNKVTKLEDELVTYKHEVSVLRQLLDDDGTLALKTIEQQEAQNASARAIMQKFVDKVDRGMARSIETHAEMKEWLDD